MAQIDHTVYNALGRGVKTYADFEQEDMARQQNALALQNAQQTGQFNALKMQQAQSEMAQQEATRNALRGFGADPDANYNSLLGVGDLEGATKYRKGITEQQKAQREAEKERLLAAKTQLELIGQAAGAAKDPASYAQARAFLVNAGIDPAQIPEQYDPALVAQARQQALTGLQQLDQELKSKQYDLDAARLGETVRHNQAGERLTAEGHRVTTRGQDVSASTTRRGQDMADARAREDAGSTQFIPVDGVGLYAGNKRTGEVRQVRDQETGAPVRSVKPLNDTQAKANLFGDRMQKAHATLADLESKGVDQPSLIKRAADGLPSWLGGDVLGMAANAVAASPEQQQVEQAQRDFLNAVLRRESGAVIGPSEFESGQKQYFPQPGDSAAVKEQKRRNRETAIKGILAEVPDAHRAPPPTPPNTPRRQSGKVGEAPAGGIKFLGFE